MKVKLTDISGTGIAILIYMRFFVTIIMQYLNEETKTVTVEVSALDEYRTLAAVLSTPLSYGILPFHEGNALCRIQGDSIKRADFSGMSIRV